MDCTMVDFDILWDTIEAIKININMSTKNDIDILVSSDKPSITLEPYPLLSIYFPNTQKLERVSFVHFKSSFGVSMN